MKQKRETNLKTQTQKENTQTTGQAKHDKHKTEENETLGKTRGDKQMRRTQERRTIKEDTHKKREKEKQEKTKPEQERDSEIATMTKQYGRQAFSNGVVSTLLGFSLSLLHCKCGSFFFYFRTLSPLPFLPRHSLPYVLSRRPMFT